MDHLLKMFRHSCRQPPSLPFPSTLTSALSASTEYILLTHSHLAHPAKNCLIVVKHGKLSLTSVLCVIFKMGLPFIVLYHILSSLETSECFSLSLSPSLYRLLYLLRFIVYHLRYYKFLVLCTVLMICVLS